MIVPTSTVKRNIHNAAVGLALDDVQYVVLVNPVIPMYKLLVLIRAITETAVNRNKKIIKILPLRHQACKSLGFKR